MPTTKQKTDTNFANALFDVDLNRRKNRLKVAQNFFGFCAIYLPHHFSLKPAEFQIDMMEHMANPEVNLLQIIGFRDSGKTTIASLAYPLWSALFKRYKFIVLIAEAGSQARLNIMNIRHELENNELLVNDFGTHENRNRWSGKRMQLDNDVLIWGASRGTSIRGMKHQERRPDLIVIDDPEDIEWVKSKSNRDKTDEWLTSQIIPARSDIGAKLVIIGNLLHRDALMARLKEREAFTTLEYPIFDESGDVAWEARYPTKQAVEDKKEEVGNLTSWKREYELKIIADDDRIIKESDLAYYETDLLEKKAKDELLYEPIRCATAVDLAISEKESADYTAIVQGRVVRYAGKRRIWVLPYLVNRHMNFSTTQDVIVNSHSRLPRGSKIVIEDVAYQRSAIEAVNDKTTAEVEGIKAVRDKRARLQSVAPKIKSGEVMFAQGDELKPLIEQMIEFGVAEHDDMVDALVYLIMELSKKERGGGTAGKVDQL